jgi:hypothetical protein
MSNPLSIQQGVNVPQERVVDGDAKASAKRDGHDPR